MAAGGCSARIAARRWPSWKQRAKLPTAAAPWRGAAQAAGAGATGGAGARGAGRGDLQLVLVESDAQRLIWNTLMAHEHPRGAGPWVGHQLRYLVGSAHGWLGGVGFAASARRLLARDAWIGWDDTGRRNQLHRVVGLCRFLIRPGVACRNLASHVLGRVVRAVGTDFERRYGYRPWLLERSLTSASTPGRVGGRRTGCG